MSSLEDRQAVLVPWRAARRQPAGVACRYRRLTPRRSPWRSRKGFQMRTLFAPRSFALFPRPWRDRLPQNRRLPLAYRLHQGPTALPAGELARDPKLALVEAALLAADEPLTTR